MGLTRQWLETKPAVTDKIKDGPAEFQARWKDVRELLNSAGITCDGVNPLAEQGRFAVDASGTGINPTIYKNDRATKILEFFNANGTLLADYLINGARNIPEATVADDVIGNVVAPTTGFKRAVKPLRIFESSPVDTKVNVKPGNYTKTGGQTVGLYAGGNLTVGIAPLTLPAAGNHAYYAIYIDGAGALTAVKGTEVILAATPVAPSFPHQVNQIGVIEIKDTSANFSILTSGANAFLISDGRPDSRFVFASSASQIVQNAGSPATQAATVRLSKAITTNGGVVLASAFATIPAAAGGTLVSFGRAGLPLISATIGETLVNSSFAGTQAEALAAGTYTYELRSTTTSPSMARIVLMELAVTTLG